MVGRPKERITESQYKVLNKKLMKMSGFNMKIERFERLLERHHIEIKTLRAENRMLKRIVEKLKERTRGL